MRKLLASLASLVALALVVAISVPVFAGEAAPAPQRFGARVTLKKSVGLHKLVAAPEKFKGRTVRIEGVVQDVCQGAGCWVEVSDGNGTSFIARSLDESVLLPKDCKGYKVVVQGLLTTMPEKKHAEGSEETHRCPTPTYVLSTQGIELTASR